MKGIFKKVVKVIMTPSLLRSKFIQWRQYYISDNRTIRCAAQLHRQNVDKLRNTEHPLRAVFLATYVSCWKYDEVFRLMVKSPYFNPIIVASPVVNYGEEKMKNLMQECYNDFSKRGFNIIKAISEDGVYVDLRKDLKADILFYTNPYKGLIDDRYYIDKYSDILSVYVQYTFTAGKNYRIMRDDLLHNLVWRHYAETQFAVRMSKRVARCKGSNMVYTGYPGIDRFITKSIECDPWKDTGRKLKRIIYAPHHTINSEAFITYSTFLEFGEKMLDIAKKHSDAIQIAFKPHPILRSKLELLWGKERTDEYYDAWSKLPNTQFENGLYEDLFLTSDAIIHDCGSFTSEYLFIEKPCLFLDNGIPYEDSYSPLDIDCLRQYYHAWNLDDIENFIKMVIADEDPRKEERKQFVQDVLMPPNGKLASQNIMDDLMANLRPNVQYNSDRND